MSDRRPSPVTWFTRANYAAMVGVCKETLVPDTTPGKMQMAARIAFYSQLLADTEKNFDEEDVEDLQGMVADWEKSVGEFVASVPSSWTPTPTAETPPASTPQEKGM